VKQPTTPTVLVIDDLFGRQVADAPNRDRENLCGKFLLEEALDVGSAEMRRFKVKQPVARAVFCRGQNPSKARVGDVVENDPAGAMAVVRQGWTEALSAGRTPWAMVLLDLCFYTGQVTEVSHQRTPGMPEGRPGDDDSQSYFGLELLDAIHREFPELPVFILSSKPREDVSLEFSRRGALGFIDRTDEHAPEILDTAIWNHGLLPDVAGEIVGNSLPLLLALREARRAGSH